MPESNHLTKKDTSNDGILCNNCIHKNICMNKTKYVEFVSEVIDIRKKYTEIGFDFEIKCGDYMYNKQPIPRNM